MDRMSLYYFKKEKEEIKNRKKLQKLITVFNSKTFK